jgi:hypothetical protein
MFSKPKLIGRPLLEHELAREFFRWNVASYSYGISYYVSRILLISASAVVAGKETLKNSSGDFLVSAVPLLAVLVAVLTALDTWLKPADRWRGFMESRDRLADLLARYGEGLSVDDTRDEFLKLREEHRVKNVF